MLMPDLSISKTLAARALSVCAVRCHASRRALPASSVHDAHDAHDVQRPRPRGCSPARVPLSATALSLRTSPCGTCPVPADERREGGDDRVVHPPCLWAPRRWSSRENQQEAELAAVSVRAKIYREGEGHPIDSSSSVRCVAAATSGMSSSHALAGSAPRRWRRKRASATVTGRGRPAARHRSGLGRGGGGDACAPPEVQVAAAITEASPLQASPLQLVGRALTLPWLRPSRRTQRRRRRGYTNGGFCGSGGQWFLRRRRVLCRRW